MDLLQNGGESIHRKSFLGHVFSTTEEGKAEILNVVQYACLGVIPIVILNKLIQRFVPEADTEKSSLELLVEVFVQLIVMFCGIIVVHRIISYIPTYSGFKYESLALTNVILAFLIIVLSIQTKLGIKVNILVDRIAELWNGPSQEKKSGKQGGQGYGQGMHQVSQADYMDSPQMQGELFPPAPVATVRQGASSAGYARQAAPSMNEYAGPVAANGVLGGSFGSFF